MSRTKWKAPIRLAWSVKATAGMRWAAVSATKLGTLMVDCKTENWVWLCKWAKVAVCKTSILLDTSCLESEGAWASPSCCRRRADASFKLVCCKPNKAIGRGFLCWNSWKYVPVACSSWSVKTSNRMSSKKQRLVASTSAVALWASAKGDWNKKECSSVRVGNLNFPPRPPGNCNKEAVISVQVSNIGMPAKGFSNCMRKNSQPMMFKSKPTFCPTTNFVFCKTAWNSAKTSASGTPCAWANSVEIPCMLSAS